MSKKVILVLGIVALLAGAGTLRAVTLSENFNDGITSGPLGWEIFQVDASSAPWTVQAPDEVGGLRISKWADTEMAGKSKYAGICSLFTLDGDFSAFVDFSLLTFPLCDSSGWNEALITVVAENSGAMFETLRFTNTIAHYAEGFNNITGPIGVIRDSTMHGKLGVTREGETMSAWLDRSAGPVLLGSMSSPLFLGPVEVSLWTTQQSHFGHSRPHTALDVRFDNFSATAQVIIPEPATLLLLGLGAVILRRKH